MPSAKFALGFDYMKVFANLKVKLNNATKM
jgi:hypothetical protein